MSRQEQIDEMGADYDYFASGRALADFYGKAYRNQPLPSEVASYLRNDPEADYEELQGEGA